MPGQLGIVMQLGIGEKGYKLLYSCTHNNIVIILFNKSIYPLFPNCWRIDLLHTQGSGLENKVRGVANKFFPGR